MCSNVKDSGEWKIVRTDNGTLIEGHSTPECGRRALSVLNEFERACGRGEPYEMKRGPVVGARR